MQYRAFFSATALAPLAFFTLAYLLTGIIGLLIQTGHEGITPIWPPSGIALFAFCRYGPRMWPVVAIGVAYSAQQVDAVVRGDHDQPLDWILTEKGPINPGKPI